MESAALYFNWLALLDTNVAVILTLMAILASLTLVSSLFILVLRRVGTIGILKALGARNRLVRQTFVLLTLKLLAIGLAAGNAVALGLILIQKTTGIVPLDPEAYYLDHVPVEISWTSVAILNGATALIAFCVLLLPSAIIATIKPARVINYE
nr:FtsX-like permease family protein [uncultured Duncaniella sp.]